MPCNSIQIAQVELGKVSPDLLALAMKAMGFFQYDFTNGLLTIMGERLSAKLTAQIKQAYSRQVVLSQAKKFGWQTKEIGMNQWEMMKR